MEPPPNGPSAPAFEENLDEDLPPPYTPAANTSIGEETIDMGPQRPFQQPSSLPSSSHHRPSGSRHSNRPSQSSIRPPPTSLGFGSSSRTQSDSLPAMMPWQSRQPYRQPRNGGGLLGALLDTAREIADVVSGSHDERAMATRCTNAGAHAYPYASLEPVYYPPRPPRHPAFIPPRPPQSTVPDDGSPTRTPVPGHPLLRDGQLLVYPKDYLCDKCHNTGYKTYDPSHPCRKCWEKYGKSYTGALAYTPWSPSGNDPRMQRALPRFAPSHLATPGLGSSSPRCHPLPSEHHLSNQPIFEPHRILSRDSGPSYYVMNPTGPYDATPPVPHAIPVSPGDPRLGGRLCHRCGGLGVRTIMLIDVMMCEDCGGTGRIWV